MPTQSSSSLNFTELKKLVSMEDLLEHYGCDVGGISFGRDWSAVECPFHDDRTASASINPLDDRFRCHGCGVGGDIIDVVVQVEGLSVRDAYEWIEDELG